MTTENVGSTTMHGHADLGVERARVIEEHFHVELLPGTEVMTDIDGVRFIHGNGSIDAVLVPQPSMDKHDPLNWKSWWKYGVVLNQGIFVLLSVITNLSIAPLTPIYIAEWNKSLQQISLLTGATVLTLGYANFIIIPSSDIFGRRPVTIICSTIVLAGNIWQALAKSYGSFLGARILSGVGAAANESIMTVVVADIFFLHQRGKFVGLYFWCYFVGLFIGPILSGQIATHVSWRWFFWVCAIAQAANLATLLFLFPETRRMAPWLSSPSNSNKLSSSSTDPVVEKKPGSDHTETTEVDVQRAESPLGKGMPSRTQFNVIQKSDREALRTVFQHVITPFKLFFFPIVFWAAWSTGSAANALLAVNLTQSQVLAAPPYNFSPGNVGFVNFALVVGGIVGLAAAGPWSDWVAMRGTRKNGGIREPEMRLWSLYPFIAAALTGLTVVGVGYQRKWAWEAIVILGFTLVGVQVVAIPTITITYAIDSYKPVAGQIMTIVTVVKNTFGFGMTYYVNDWAVKDGFIPPLMLLMTMTVGFTLAGTILLPIYGKMFRRMTRSSPIHDF